MRFVDGASAAVVHARPRCPAHLLIVVNLTMVHELVHGTDVDVVRFVVLLCGNLGVKNGFGMLTSEF